MTNLLKDYTREELEKKILHMAEFVAYKLASEYIELTEPTAKVIRTAEAEVENTNRILELIVLIYPAWDVVEKIYPSYDLMKPWIQKNHEQTLVKPCICSGCKTEDVAN